MEELARTSSMEKRNQPNKQKTQTVSQFILAFLWRLIDSSMKKWNQIQKKNKNPKLSTSLFFFLFYGKTALWPKLCGENAAQMLVAEMLRGNYPELVWIPWAQGWFTSQAARDFIMLLKRACNFTLMSCLLLEVFHLIFSVRGWPWVIKTAESATVDKGRGHYGSLLDK